MSTRAYTVFPTGDDFPITEGHELHGDLFIVHHNTKKMEIVPGTSLTSAEQVECLIETLREARAFMRGLEGAHDERA